MSVRHNRDGRPHDKEDEFIPGMVIIIHMRTSIHAAAPTQTLSCGSNHCSSVDTNLNLRQVGLQLHFRQRRAPPAFASPSVVFDLLCDLLARPLDTPSRLALSASASASLRRG